MSLEYPEFLELVGQIRAEFRKNLPEVDPTIHGSWARAFGDGNAVLCQENMLTIRDLEKQLFPQTATDTFLEIWGAYEGLTRNPAVGATGIIALDDTTAVVTTVIPALTVFTGSNGVDYHTTAVSTITATNQVIASIARVGTTATATMASAHSLATGISVVVSGATQAGYNGTFTITVTARDTFTFTVDGATVTPATGAPVYDINLASITVNASTAGATTNLETGAQLTNATYGTALVGFDGLSGGASLELDEPYRTRIMLSRSIIQGVFTPDQIKLAALGVSGNTRAFVTKAVDAAAGGAVAPFPGQCSCHFLRDNDANPMPTAGVIATTKQAIIDNGKLPANSAEADLFVQGPTLVPAAFTFTAISPDTSTMETAIENTLTAFFQDSVEFGTTVTEASFLGAIQNTQDLETGAFLVSFTITAPAADIAIAAGELASLGVVTF